MRCSSTGSGVVRPASRVSPGSGPNTGGTSVTITGTGFSGATAVNFGATAASSFTVNNATTIRDGLLSFATYPASLKSKAEAIDSVLAKADDAFAGIDSVFTKIDDVMPGIANGQADYLLQKVQTIRELAESFNKRSGALMEEGRRTLLDVSQAANRMTGKLGAAGEAVAPAPPRKPQQKRH